MRIGAFVVALLLLAGNVDPTRGWLIVLVVLTGLAATRLHHGPIWRLRPALDARLAAFVLALLLLAGTVDATRDWFIALTAVTGVAAFMPRIFALDEPRGGDWRMAHPRFDWDRWERTMDRRWRRRADRFGDDWS